MILSRRFLRNICSLMYAVHLTCTVTATQFASHVSVNTPARSFSHGVGDPVAVLERRAYHRLPQSPPIRKLRIAWIVVPTKLQGCEMSKSMSRTFSLIIYTPSGSFSRYFAHCSTHYTDNVTFHFGPNSQSPNGYPRHKPAIPFHVEEVHRGNSINRPWRYNNFMAVPIQVLPPSPYKVDSPDPESLWPIGLFIPPVTPQRYGSQRRSGTHISGSAPDDPYLLEGSEAIAAVTKSTRHGQLYFHDIPHIESLLANQDLRVQNNLKPHRIASIRQTWPFNRP